MSCAVDKKRWIRRIYRTVLLLLPAVLSMSTGSTAYALSQADLYSILNNTPFYDACQEWTRDTATDDSTSGGTPLTGDGSLKQIFDYFASNGFTKEQAAGIVGNIKAESGGDPRKLQGGQDFDTPPDSALAAGSQTGWGIVQWTPPTSIVNYANSVHQPADALTTQMDFLLKQLNGTTPGNVNSEKPAGTALKQVTSPITINGIRYSVAWHAALVFLQDYERAADTVAGGPNSKTRGTFADEAMAAFGNDVISSPTSSTGSATTTTGTSTSTTSTTLLDADLTGVGCATSAANPTNTVWYSQHDPRWANDHFACGDGDCGTFSDEGCYLTDLAMIASSLTHTYVYPNKVTARVSAFLAGNPSPAALASQYKLTINPKQFAPNGILDGDPTFRTDIAEPVTQEMLTNSVVPALQAGDLVLAHGSGQNTPPWVSGNHWVVIRGLAPGSTAANPIFLINDPWDFTRPPTPDSGASNLDPNQARYANGQKGPYTNDTFPASDFIRLLGPYRIKFGLVAGADELYIFGKQ